MSLSVSISSIIILINQRIRHFCYTGGMMTVYAPAKINLTLAVSEKRLDGFHDLDSVVVPIGLVDTITLEHSGFGIRNSELSGGLPPTPALRSHLSVISETVDLSAMPEDVEKNLAMRALRLLEKEVGRALPTQITIKKNIPLGGGLGGGSSNAAAVLRGVNELWGLGLSRERLCELGAQLGSDVALFIMDGLVRMRGRGERVERLDASGIQPQWVVLANCGAHCSTPAVYGAFDASRQKHNSEFGIRNLECAPAGCAEDGAVAGTRPCKTEQALLEAVVRQSANQPISQSANQASKLPNFQTSNLTNGDEMCDTLHLSLQAGEVSRIADGLMNDLEAPCYELFPEVAETAKAVEAAGGVGVRLCGSGATVFGLVRSREEGECALAHPSLQGCWRACVQTLPDGVMAAHGPLTPIVMVRIHVGQP